MVAAVSSDRQWSTHATFEPDHWKEWRKMLRAQTESAVAEPYLGRTWTAEGFADLYDLNSTFGRLAAEARAEYFNAGGKPLDREGIEREVAERRSGTFTRP